MAVITGEAMGTTYRIKYFGDLDALELESLLNGLNADLSTWQDDSWVARFNSAPAGQPMEMPGSVRELMVLSKILNERSEGRFDPAIGALIRVWGFGAWKHEFRSEPTEAEVESARRASGFHLLQIDGNTLNKTRDGVMLDFSAIAKGYAVDLMANQLLEAGCEDFVIEFGGDLLARGNAPGKVGWTVDGPSLPEPITLINEAIATSGSRHHSRGALSHVIDPSRGRPVAVDITVSVVAPTCAEADALATSRLVEAARK